MNEPVVLLALAVALGPVRVTHLTPGPDRPRRVPVSCGLAALIALIGVAAADSLVDALGISEATGLIAAGLITAAVGLRRLALGPLAPYPELDGRWAVLVPGVFPAALAPDLVALAVGASLGVGPAALALGGAVLVSAGVARVADRRGPAIPGALVRLGGVISVAGAITLVIEGVRAV